MSQMMKELKAADERSKKEAADGARLAEELTQEREHGQYLERMKKGLEMNLKTLQAKLEDAETAARKGNQKAVMEYEKRIRTIQVIFNNQIFFFREKIFIKKF